MQVRERITFAGADPRARFTAMLLANALLALVVTLTYFGLSALLSPFCMHCWHSPSLFAICCMRLICLFCWLSLSSCR